LILKIVLAILTCGYYLDHTFYGNVTRDSHPLAKTRPTPSGRDSEDKGESHRPASDPGAHRARTLEGLSLNRLKRLRGGASTGMAILLNETGFGPSAGLVA